MKILFSSHLSGKAEDWYGDLGIEGKGSWPTLIKNFKTYYQLTPRFKDEASRLLAAAR